MRSNLDTKKEVKTKSLMAQTHPAEYLIHKYWARKPHNILRHYLETFFKEGDLVVDPFCGSGVFLAEAKKLGINAEGMDINPVAYLISEVTANPPDLPKFIEESKKIIEYIQNKYSYLYTLDDGSVIRYVVHQINTKCPKCRLLCSINNSKKQSSRYYCSICSTKLSFNFENFHDIEIIKIIDKNNRVHNTIPEVESQKQKSNFSKPRGDFDKNLITNRRILAFPEMKLSDLFTPRAYSIISDLFEQAHRIKDDSIRHAILLLLTSGVAQCSRLIPFRNNLTTGGPAWTVPGFWIAPLHLETNPIIHFEARLKKFLKGIENLNKGYKDRFSTIVVKNISAQQGLAKLKDNSIDGIFFDPPYGDNVPYIEFSAIWNGFLRRKIAYTEEMVVSDRKEFISSWYKYSKDIKNIIGLFYEKLKKDGKIIMTFNNLDPRAWKIVLESFSDLSLHCIEAKYQIPAVVSSKAQMASNTSYIGDYYCVFEKKNSKVNRRGDLYYLTDKLKKILLSRNGKAPVNLINRVAILTILNENLPIDLIEKIEDAVMPIALKEENYYIIRDEIKINSDSGNTIDSILKEIAISELSTEKRSIKDFYEMVLAKTDEFGGVQIAEVKTLLKGLVFFEGEFCYLQDKRITQLPLTLGI